MREDEITDSRQPLALSCYNSMAEPNARSVALCLLSLNGLPHVECSTYSGSRVNGPTSPMLASILLLTY